MIITVGIVTTLALASYLGYKNKNQVFWNGVKLYNSIKDYYLQFCPNFTLKDISFYNGKHYLPISPSSYNKLDIILFGFFNTNNPKNNPQIGISYILNDRTFCKIYCISMDYKKDAKKVMNDIEMLEEYNKALEVNSFELPVNFILSASYFNVKEDIDVTELLQMFDVNGTFYETNDYLSFYDILKWNIKLNLFELNNVPPVQEAHYVEIINIYGDIKEFKLDDILCF